MRPMSLNTQAHDSVCNLKALCFMAESKVASVPQLDRWLSNQTLPLLPAWSSSPSPLLPLILPLDLEPPSTLCFFCHHTVVWPLGLVSTVLKRYIGSYRGVSRRNKMFARVLVFLQYSTKQKKECQGVTWGWARVKNSCRDWHLVKEDEDKDTQRKVWCICKQVNVVSSSKSQQCPCSAGLQRYFHNFIKLFLCFTNCPPSTLVNSFAKVQAHSSPTCLCARKGVPSPAPRGVFCKRGLLKNISTSSLLLFA